ncbi:MAG TPA: RuvA C-terminal domain-containing protein [Candidatus Limnocylindria bacterium]|nr:RuvA C-terminal domain-containing protein [Candidatus Limnocylindria bacterium]
MRAYTLTHLSDAVLLRSLTALVAQDCATTAALLAHIAEVDARKLYLPAGYPSMHAYCIDELRLSDDAAYKRIQAARAARQFPALLTALAEGRLHLAAVCLLAPHLTPENAGELLAAVVHRRKSDIEQMLARRFPRLEERPAMIRALPATSFPPNAQLAPGQVATHTELVGALAPGQVEALAPRPEGALLLSERFALQLSIGKGTHDKLRYAQALLSHAVPSGDVTQVLDRALDALIGQLEKRKFADTKKPRPAQHSNVNKRHVPAHVKRAVWERDHGQCTFVSASGHRCEGRRFLEFDHVDPVARGGRATAECIRLRCRAHNQYEAERTFGAGFMIEKRDRARRAANESRARAVARDAAETRASAAAREQTRDVVAGLRELGFRADEARRAAEFSATLHGATLEGRVRAALKFLCRKPASTTESGRAWGVST